MEQTEPVWFSCLTCESFGAVRRRMLHFVKPTRRKKRFLAWSFLPCPQCQPRAHANATSGSCIKDLTQQEAVRKLDFSVSCRYFSRHTKGDARNEYCVIDRLTEWIMEDGLTGLDSRLLARQLNVDAANGQPVPNPKFRFTTG